MDKIKDIIVKVNDALQDQTKPWFEMFRWAEQQTGLSKIQLLIAVAILVILGMMTKFFAAALSNIIGFAYPAYYTIETLDKHNQKPEETTQFCTTCLKYWMIFIMVLIIEYPFSGFTY